MTYSEWVQLGLVQDASVYLQFEESDWYAIATRDAAADDVSVWGMPTENSRVFFGQFTSDETAMLAANKLREYKNHPSA